MPSKSKSIISSNKSKINEIFNKQSSSSYSFELGIIVFGLIISIFVLNWLVKVHKCKCANINEGLYLKEWFTFIVAYQIIIAILFISGISLDEIAGILGIFSIIIAIVSFIMIIRLLIYIHKLKEIKCDCGMTKEENIIYYYFIVVYSISLFFILLGIIASIIMQFK